MFANDWSAAEGIVGSWEAPDNNDNRWLISALNIVAANRTQASCRLQDDCGACVLSDGLLGVWRNEGNDGADGLLGAVRHPWWILCLSQD